MKIEHINLLTTALCDLKCKYCYIEKNHNLKKIHEKLVNKLKEENFLDCIKNSPLVNPNEIKSMGFWGLEPTKTLDIISERFDYIFETFPNFESFDFSTNLQNGNDSIINFIEKLGNERKIKIGIQVSMDGMPEINNIT